MSKKRLEVPKMRGVEDLLTMDVDTSPITTVSIHKIRVAKKQPRRWFDPEKMSQLVQSVRSHGILEPLLVRPLGNGEYELIAGERRLRAGKSVGLAEVPIVSKELSDQQALQIALLENLQREDLNPVEEVEAILELLALNLDVSTEEIKSILNEAANAKKRDLELTGNVSRQLEEIESLLASIGRFNAESFRTSRLPLLNLPSDVLEVLRQGQLEFTKARTIARIKDERKRADVLSSAIAQNLSLTQIKQLIKQLQSSEINPEATPEKVLSNRYAEIGKRLQQAQLWKDDKKRKKLERLLSDLEKLLDESDLK
ncbi:ParB/RepB/Spo0J family partition protein [Nostocales cyanobacterium LEGE 11386]|nr:ParB/RepB/Spo0J family partition protein [Nostocales cyanobacterium LEGE 11386]